MWSDCIRDAEGPGESAGVEDAGVGGESVWLQGEGLFVSQRAFAAVRQPWNLGLDSGTHIISAGDLGSNELQMKYPLSCENLCAETEHKLSVL